MPNVPNNILRVPPFCTFGSVSLTLFNNKPESLRDLIIFVMFSISLFGIISVVVLDRKIFLCIPVSAADAAVISPNVIKKLLASCLITFFTNGNAAFNNGPRSLPSMIVLF